MAEIDIRIEARGWDSLAGASAIVETAANAAFRVENRSGEVAILLTDDAAMRRLNAAFRGLDKPTNVLSFPAARPPGRHPPAESLFLGDIALGYETCRSEASDERKTLNDHLSHLVVHGVLHLLGYDHATKSQAEAMETRERLILASMGIADPYTGAGEAPVDE